MRLEDALKEFIYDCRLRKMSERTIKGYRNNTAKMIHYLDSQHAITELEEVTAVHIKTYLNYLVSLKRKETYINSLIKAFRSFFHYCVFEAYIPESPMDKVRFQREPITLIETFTDAEVQRMISSFHEKDFYNLRNKTILVVFFDSGIRCQELCDLRLDDIKDNALRIMGKGKKERFVPLTPAINKFLMKYIRMRENYLIDKYQLDKEYLFLSVNSRKLTIEAVERIVKEAAEKSNVRGDIRSSPHTCRHFYAQAQLRNGCDVYTLSRLLGHNNISITKRYLQSITDEAVLEMGKQTTPLSKIL